MPVPGLKHLVDYALPEGITGFVELKKLDAQIKGPQLFVNKVRPRRCTFFLNWQPAFFTFIDCIRGAMNFIAQYAADIAEYSCSHQSQRLHVP